MTSKKHPSPTLVVDITEDQWERAVASNSGGCLISDAIRKQYPHLSAISTDMATIRASDRQKGIRYIYLTPPDAQHLLLSFDQGWPQPTQRLTIRRAVQIVPIVRAPSAIQAVRQSRAEKIAALRAKQAAGQSLGRRERAQLTRLLNAQTKGIAERPSTYGAPKIEISSGHGVIVQGGAPIPQGPAHPNLLRGRNRHFGAKLADAGKAFKEAVEAELVKRLHELSG